MLAKDLYAELKDDVAAVVNPLFEFSERGIKKYGNFLPHGAYMEANGKVGLVGAAPENDLTNSLEVLPLLHEGLRSSAKDKDLIAIGVAENVTVTPHGQSTTKAIKVLFEHKQGLVVALYLPFKKKFLLGYTFGQAFTLAGNAEVNAWAEIQ